MRVKVVRHTVVEKPIEDVIREFLEEGWCPIMIKKGDSAWFQISDEVLAKALKAGEN